MRLFMKKRAKALFFYFKKISKSHQLYIGRLINKGIWKIYLRLQISQ